MVRYALTLAYEGSDYSGFARQKDPAIITVQEVLEQALATVLRLDIAPETVCAGRTDAGVHALAQVVSFELAGPALDARACGRIVRSLNAITPESMSVKLLQRTTEGFSARFDAQSREYRYYIANTIYPPIFSKNFAWHIPTQLDLDVMKNASQYLRGKHDFRSFCTSASAADDKNTVRELSMVEVFEQSHFGENLICIRIVGNAFLHSMVRIIVGTLVEIAAAKRGVDEIPSILNARKREAAGQTAPAHGLTLHKVEYLSSDILKQNN